MVGVDVAAYVIGLACAIAVPATVVIVVRELGGSVASWTAGLLLLGVTLSPPYRQGLVVVNVGLLLVPLLAHFVVALGRNRPTVAGLGLGLSIALKPVLVPLVLLLIGGVLAFL